MNWLVSMLAKMALRIMPPAHADWANAMFSEGNYVADDGRLRWAFGCLITSLRQRFTLMDTGNFRISRPVMLIEMLGCFGPLTLAWYELAFGPSGAVRLTGEIIDKYFLSYSGGTYVLTMMILGVVVWSLGPVGLFLGLRYVLRGEALTNRAFGYAAIGAMLLYNVLGTMGGYLAGPSGFVVALPETFLLSALPVAGILHLMYLAGPTSRTPSGSVIAA